ncbi:MAG: UDP-N-acetylmuramate--L-alanine ligase [Chloroflexi bacterium]|nr:UDP-N-acetylmuramate--L-alanine ligase [Chloroflexota bacterium]
MTDDRAIDQREPRKVHIVGIGGAGMSAIARVLTGRGLTVSGSDRRGSSITAALGLEGIRVAIGHAAENIGDADLVLASSAVPDDNVELVAAQARGIRVQRRREFLPTLTAGYDVIAVAGAHGKTTVSGMIALAMLEAGLDPTYIVGGVLANLATNGSAGTGRHFVIEADEYQRTFLGLSPGIAVVTNVEFDHPDCYPDLGHVRLAFGEFVDNIVQGGLLVACGDDVTAYEIAAAYQASGGRVVLYGCDRARTLAWRATDVRRNVFDGISFAVEHEGRALGQIDLRIPGEFNVLNALGALAVGHELGLSWEALRSALAQFGGTARRFETLGEVCGVTVIDDYAHHPTQIRGVLRAARLRYADRRIIAVWEPHTFSRIRALWQEFMTAFGDADAVVVLPIYAARERDDGTLTARDLAQQVGHSQVTSTDSLDEAVTRLAALSQPGDVVLMMGAGNETIVGQRLVETLRQGVG